MYWQKNEFSVTQKRALKQKNWTFCANKLSIKRNWCDDPIISRNSLKQLAKICNRKNFTIFKMKFFLALLTLTCFVAVLVQAEGSGNGAPETNQEGTKNCSMNFKRALFTFLSLRNIIDKWTSICFDFLLVISTIKSIFQSMQIATQASERLRY